MFKWGERGKQNKKVSSGEERRTDIQSESDLEKYKLVMHSHKNIIDSMS